MPPPGIAGAPPCFFGTSATMASVVISSPAIDPAFCRAERTTLVGSMMLSLLKTRFERIDGVVRQGLDTRQCLRIVRLAVCRARPSLLWFAVTRHPTAEWLAQQIVEAFPWSTAPTYLVRDNDRAYGQAFTRRLRTMGIRDRPISPRSPWQNPYVERLIGTVRRECLDHVLIFGERHLRRIAR